MAPSQCSTAASHVLVPRSQMIRPNLAFYLLASITVSFLAGSLAPTPLSPIYQARWGFSALTVTEIFGIYAFALLGSLLVFGRLSDHIGRRPVLIATTLAQAMTMLLFVNAGSADGLMLARLVQGLVTGAALGAIGAGMIDINKTLGPVANAIAPMMGIATGSILAGLMVRYLPAPTSLVYLLLAAVYLAQMVGVALMTETVIPRPGAVTSLVPKVGLPPTARHQMALAVPILIAVWSLAGFYGSLAPAVARDILGLNPSMGGGLLVFIFAGTGALSIFLTRNRLPRAVKIYGASALLTGCAVLAASFVLHSLAGFLVGTVIAGSGFGSGFQGAVRSVTPLAQPDERAGVLSVIFAISYLALGLPAIAAGSFVARGGQLEAAGMIFVNVVAILAILALLGEISVRKRNSMPGRINQ